MAKAYINEVSISKKFVNAAKKDKYVNFMRSAANTRFQFARQLMLEELDSHPVTKELQQSPSEPGSAQVSKGNLVSFLGLSDGASEVANVREYLRKNTELGSEVKITEERKNINYSFKVEVPSKTQVFEAFPAPDSYSSKSWLEIIEKGIGSAAQYIFWSLGFNTVKSRSGTGLQSKGEVKNVASLKTRPYISEILDNFRKKFL